MLSLRSIPVQSASALAAYYEGMSKRPDGYYQGGAGLLEPAGIWHGQGARVLGLADTVIVEGELLRGMEGLHPRTDLPLSGTAGHGHKPGWDLTFSSPKSVSAAWAVADPDLREAIAKAHQDAVSRALDYLERDAIAVRIRADRHTMLRESVAQHGGALFATYEHSASRAGDPQLHTHAVLMNLTPDGRSLDFSATHVHAGGAIYRSELAHRLQALGFGIERDGQSFKLSGSPEQLIERWSQRRAKIEAEAAARGISSAKGLETVTLATRSTKEAQSRASLFLQWEGEAKEYEYHAAAVRQQATLGLSQELDNVPEAGLLTALTETRATVSREQALVELAARSYGKWNATELQAQLGAALKTQALVLHAPEIRAEWHRSRARYTTMEMLRLEQQLLNRCEHLAQERDVFYLSESSRRAALGAADLSQEQRRAFDHALDSGRTAAIQGAAGSGKSTLLRTVHAAYARDNYRVIGTALSQRATRGLEEASNIPSRNVARLLIDLEAGNERLNARTILIVDEAGMVGTRQMEELVRRVDEAEAKVILVGDVKQLQAIEAGGAFRGIQERIGYAELLDNRRQQKEIDREMAVAFREGRAIDGLEILHQHGRLYVHRDPESIKQTAILAYLQDLDEGKSSLLLAKDRQAVHELNDTVRTELKAEDRLGKSEVAVKTTNGYRHFAEQDRVVLSLGAKQQFAGQLERQDREHAHNGACGTVERVTPEKITIQLDSGHRIELDGPGHLDREGRRQGWAVDHGYAVTVHKAQGMTVDRSHVVISGEEQREWAYVALSRHRETAHVYATHDALGADGDAVERAEAALQLSRAESKDLANDYQVEAPQSSPELEII